MAPVNMGPRKFAFLISEANNNRSREEVTVTSGTGGILSSALVQDNSGTWEEIGVGDTPEGILTEGIDDADGVAVTKSRVIIVRDAEVDKSELNYPTGASAAQITAMDTALAALGIVLR